MERIQLQRRTSSTSQPRPFVYRSANQACALPHPLRRATDPPTESPAPTAAFAQPRQAVLLQFRITARHN